MNELMTETLVSEYEAIITGLGSDATDEQVVRALIVEGDWTEQGAVAVVILARRYETFVLRNALALANAMKIEDGDAGY